MHHNFVDSENGIYLGSVALEPNRWRRGDERQPSFPVSAFSERAQAAGFTGWELWEDHFFKADLAERAALAQSPLPVRIFNTYAIPGVDSPARFAEVNAAIAALGPQVHGVKFNLGPHDGDLQAQIAATIAWAHALPSGVRLLCECHPGTLLEIHENALKAFDAWQAIGVGRILHPLGANGDAFDDAFSLPGAPVCHLHWQSRDADNRMAAMDYDPERLHDAVRQLRAQHFNGTHAIEFVEGTGAQGATPALHFDAAIGALNTLQDAFATIT